MISVSSSGFVDSTSHNPRLPRLTHFPFAPRAEMLKAMPTPSSLIRRARRPDYPHFRDHELVAASFRMVFADCG